MLSITRLKYNTNYIEDQWHIGQDNPISYAEVSNVVEIQADGDELEHIKRNIISSNHIPKGKVIRLFGDYAKTVVGNLTNIK